MVDLFGSSRRDRIQLVSTLQSLGQTSIAGLAAALSWSERRTERVILAVGRHADARLEFDVSRRTVRIAPHRSGGVAVHPTVPESRASPTTSPGATSRTSPRTSDAPPPLPNVSGDATSINPPRCPSCHSRLTPAGMLGIYVCSGCGELHHMERGAARLAEADGTPTPPAGSGLAAPSAPRPSTPLQLPVIEDRHGQELFAAWVTAQPIHCPKCRTPLRHRGIGKYGCPACGTHVSFDNSGAVTRGAPAPSIAPGPPA